MILLPFSFNLVPNLHYSIFTFKVHCYILDLYTHFIEVGGTSNLFTSTETCLGTSVICMNTGVSTVDIVLKVISIVQKSSTFLLLA